MANRCPNCDEVFIGGKLWKDRAICDDCYQAISQMALIAGGPRPVSDQPDEPKPYVGSGYESLPGIDHYPEEKDEKQASRPAAAPSSSPMILRLKSFFKK